MLILIVVIGCVVLYQQIESHKKSLCGSIHQIEQLLQPPPEADEGRVLSYKNEDGFVEYYDSDDDLAEMAVDRAEDECELKHQIIKKIAELESFFSLHRRPPSHKSSNPVERSLGFEHLNYASKQWRVKELPLLFSSRGGRYVRKAEKAILVYVEKGKQSPKCLRCGDSGVWGGKKCLCIDK